MRRTWFGPVLLAAALFGGWARPPATAPNRAATDVQVSAPLGTVTSVPVSVDNSGQSATTALLYEALPAPATPAAPAPPGSLRVPLPDLHGPITPDLLAAFARASDGQSDMMIYMADQADLSAAAALANWNARGAAVVGALQAEAATRQAPLLAGLHSAGYAPHSFWIVNAIEVKGNRALAESLATQPGVALVAANVQHVLAAEPAEQAPAGTGDPAWGLSKIRVPGVWSDWGVRGAGITVANLDTGVAYTHTALLHQYRGWSPTGVSHDYNWFDPGGDKPSLQPVDAAGHGTHTMGTLVGGAAGGYSGLGIAPAAQWIAVRGCAGLFCTDAALIAGAQWLLAPTDLAGKNPRPDLRPQIINNSWGQAGDAQWYTGYVTAWNASGIFSAFAIGNNGSFSTCANTITPGSYANSFAVGATDSADLAADFSSRGPTSDGRVKPDISAPGVAVPSAWPDGGVRLLSGTSMATPHVAGVVALLWSANPTLIGDLAATERILTSTALLHPTSECGGPSNSPNNVYGWGRVDARAAVQQARVELPWMALPATLTLPANGQGSFPLTLDARQVTGPGTYQARVLVVRGGGLTAIPVTFTVQAAPNTASLSGRLTDLWQGGGVYGQVQLGNGPAVQGDAGGYYTATLPYGSYTLTATATGYLSATSELPISAPSAADFILQADLPHIRVVSSAISATLAFGQHVQVPITVTNRGTQPLTVTATVPTLDWVVEQAGAAAEPLYDLSTVKPVSLTDDSIYTEPLQIGFQVPIFGLLVDQVYLSSNGWVSAVLPTSAEPLVNCLPNTFLPPFSLAPFWADLDPGVAGAVRFARVDADTFVVSFEQVPPWRETPDPSGPTYTFQLVLHAKGDVDYLYGPMGALPDRWAAGAAFDGTRAQPLACYRTDATLPTTAWRLHNQPSSNFWLGASAADLTVAPGQTAAIQAVVSGFGYAAWHPGPFMGILRLLTNDPAEPAVDLPANASVGPPPHRINMPFVDR